MLRLVEVSLEYEQGTPFAWRALTEIDLEVAAGERLGLGGPSGAGKSSLLLVAGGLLKPTCGRVERQPGVRVGLVLQEPEMALFARTVREELAFAPRQLGLECAAEEALVLDALARLGLALDVLGQDPLHLPSAEQRLVAIAAVLTGQPDLLLLDEPAVGLDALARTRLLGIVRGFPGAVVVASHDLDFLWRTCDSLALLGAGRLVLRESWRQLLAQPGCLGRLGLELPPPLQTLVGLAERGWVLAEPGHDEEAVAAAIVGGGPREECKGGEG